MFGLSFDKAKAALSYHAQSVLIHGGMHLHFLSSMQKQNFCFAKQLSVKWKTLFFCLFTETRKTQRGVLTVASLSDVQNYESWKIPQQPNEDASMSQEQGENKFQHTHMQQRDNTMTVSSRRAESREIWYGWVGDHTYKNGSWGGGLGRFSTFPSELVSQRERAERMCGCVERAESRGGQKMVQACQDSMTTVF